MLPLDDPSIALRMLRPDITCANAPVSSGCLQGSRMKVSASKSRVVSVQNGEYLWLTYVNFKVEFCGELYQ